MAQTLTVIVIILCIVAWFAFGSPATTVANTLWPNAPAPWESVTGYYFPNKGNHAQGVMNQDSGTVGQCRSWGSITIAASPDANGEHSEYWCGIGCSTPSDMTTCRTAVK